MYADPSVSKSFNEISAESQIYFTFLKEVIKAPRF